MMAAHVNTTTTTNLGSGSGSSSHNNPNQWSVDDVAEWLGIIGLGHKAETLKTQGVTGAQLSRMSEGDLKNLGLTALQVRKIQNALPQPPASGAASTTTMRSSAGDTTTTTVELKRELESLKAQVAMLTASMNSLQASSSSSSTTAAVMATPVLAQPVATPSSNANAPSHKVRVPGFCRDCFIEGNQSQILTVVMGPGDVVQADKGAMVHMSSYIQMDTTTGGQGFGRLLTGSTLFLTEYQYTGPPNTADEIAFSPDFAGQIIPIDLRQYGGHVICQQSSILASSPTVKVSIEFSQSLGAGFFGGEGFILQGLRGSGHAFLNARGTIVTMVLRPGEQRIVSTGCLVGFQATVKYDVVTTGGLKNMLLSGEGVFNTRLTGPGTIWLESQDLNRLMNVFNKATRPR